MVSEKEFQAAELLLAKQDTEVLEVMIWTQGRDADHECKEEGGLGRCNYQLPIHMSLGCGNEPIRATQLFITKV